MTYKFYIAGCGNKSVEKTIRKHDMHRLLSWVNERKVIEDRCRSGYSTFVDSGAFSAATRGLQINVDEYIEWLNQWHSNVERYCCWDTIPTDEVSPDVSAEKTWNNYLYMKERLTDPSKLVYCYHYGEDVKYLKQALESGIDFVALGGIAKKGRAARHEFFTKLEPIFKEYPHVHVHAFGMTAIDILDKYTYIDSSDSSSWLYPPKFGRIQTETCRQVYFGTDFTKQSNVKESYDNLPSMQQHLLEVEINSMGMTLEDMQGNIGRCDWQLLHWNNKMKSVKR